MFAMVNEELSGIYFDYGFRPVKRWILMLKRRQSPVNKFSLPKGYVEDTIRLGGGFKACRLH